MGAGDFSGVRMEIYALLKAIPTEVQELKTSMRDLIVRSARTADMMGRLDLEFARIAERLGEASVDMRAIAGAVDAKFGDGDAR